MNITNLPAFHAAMAALAPIDGVAGDGHIFFQASATPAQIAAANAAALVYVDPAPTQSPQLAALVQELISLGVLPPANAARVMKSSLPPPPVPPIAPLPPARSSPF
jgi:hypothetical protein